jgi:hypothetical protein
MFDIDVSRNIVRIQIHNAVILMDGVASGRKPMQLICGPSGFGKTAIAMKRFKAHGIVPPRPDGLELKPWQRLLIDARPTQAISLVRVLYQCVQANAAALLLDDPGPLAHNEECLDVLKTSFGAQRTVMLETPQIVQNEIWRLSAHPSYNAAIPPPNFRTGDLRFLWLSNTDFLDPKLRKKLAEHFDALVARGLNPHRISDDAEHDNQALFEYVLWLVTVKNLLRNLGYPYGVSRRAVNFYVENANRLHDLSPRRMELLASLFREDLPSETLEVELANHLSATDLRPKLKVRSSGLLWPGEPFNTGRLEEPEKPQPPPKHQKPPQKKPAAEPPQPGGDAATQVEPIILVDPPQGDVTALTREVDGRQLVCVQGDIESPTELPETPSVAVEPVADPDPAALQAEITALLARLKQYESSPAPPGGRYWRVPPDVYAKLDDEFHFTYDPCPFPRTDGYDALTAEWGAVNLVNPPFKQDDALGGRATTAFARKSVEQQTKGKTTVFLAPTNAYVNVLLAAGAEVRPLGRVRWLEVDTGEPWKSPNNISAFILRGHEQPIVPELQDRQPREPASPEPPIGEPIAAPDVITFSTTRARVPLDGLNLSEQVGLKIEDTYGLKGFRGRTNPTKGPAIIQTATARIRRRAFFHLHSDLAAETVEKLREKPREFWLDCATIDDVLRRLDEPPP